ncbi:hypothetical protein D3C76_1061530 [compost metagenome]
MSLGRLHWRQGDKVHAHLLSQRQLFGTVAGCRQPALLGERPAPGGVLAQLRGRQVPTGRREITQPFQWPFKHQLRLARTQPDRIHRHVAVLGVVHVRGTQLDQANTIGHRLLDALEHLRHFQAVRGDQVLVRQARSGDDRLVGLGEFVLRQIARGNPLQRLAFGTMGFASERFDLAHVQQHLLVRVVMADLDQRTRMAYLDAQLLAQLAGKRRFDAFAFFHLATGELPQAALVLGIGTACDQNTAISTANHGSYYMNPFHASRSSRPACCHAWKAGH